MASMVSKPKYMNYENLSSKKFKRRFGVHKQTFKKMVKAIKIISEPVTLPLKRGRKCKLSLEEQILVTLEYCREYRTYFHIGTSWGVSESTICRVVNKIEDKLLKSGGFRIPGKKILLNNRDQPEITVMDVTETPIERPKKKQKDFYSGKAGYHTLKCQLIANQETKQIISVDCGKGRSHDFALFKASKTSFHPETIS